MVTKKVIEPQGKSILNSQIWKIHQTLATYRVISGSAAVALPGSLDIQTHKSHPDLLNQNLHFNMILTRSICPLEFEKHYPTTSQITVQIDSCFQDEELISLQSTYSLEDHFFFFKKSSLHFSFPITFTFESLRFIFKQYIRLTLLFMISLQHLRSDITILTPSLCPQPQSGEKSSKHLDFF